MAERSFAEEVDKLRLGDGGEFRGEAIVAVTKALLQSGVAYVGGYQGSPISHLMDVLADASEVLDDLGVHFESSASEAAACAMLAASVNYPLRGAVTWKSVVGTNVASDALSNLASGGVKGGALIIIGEDYGEGSSIMQERSHAFAMKSQVWLLDPRPNLPSIVNMVEHGFRLSEASNTPVMFQLRIRTCHMYGRFATKENRRPSPTVKEVLSNPRRDISRIVLPPASYVHEQEKIARRWPAAVDYIRDNGLNEWFNAVGEARSGHGAAIEGLGLVVQGGLFNTLLRAMEQVGLADARGNPALPIYVLNVTYPLVDEEVLGFCADKRAILLVEEGQPEFIEQSLNSVLRNGGLDTRVVGKAMLPRAGEYTAQVLIKGLQRFVKAWCPDGELTIEHSVEPHLPREVEALANLLPIRPPGFCTGCPERPIFTAMRLLQREIGPLHLSCDVGCHLFSINPPFNLGNTTMGYGLGSAGASAFSRPAGTPSIAVMGDGGFWHNGLVSGVGNAVFNRAEQVLLIVDNGYSAATGGQDVLSSRAGNRSRSTGHPIAAAVRGVGVSWLRVIDRTYDLRRMIDTLREALTTRKPGPKVIIAASECMLNRQRRERPLLQSAIAKGSRVIRTRYGVDAETCTGDHSCIRLSGCPSLTIRPNPDPLRRDPVAYVDNSCVGCGLCGEVAHAAVLCPSFYRAELIHNPTRWDRLIARLRGGFIAYLQRLADRRRALDAF